MAVRLLGGHCFYIKKMDVLCERWECKSYRQIFTRDENLIRHFKKEKQKLSVQAVNSSTS